MKNIQHARTKTGLRTSPGLTSLLPHFCIKASDLSSPVLGQDDHPAGATSCNLCLRALLLGDQWCVVRKWSYKCDCNTVSCLWTLMPHTQCCLQAQISEEVPLWTAHLQETVFRISASLSPSPDTQHDMMRSLLAGLSVYLKVTNAAISTFASSGPGLKSSTV